MAQYINTILAGDARAFVEAELQKLHEVNPDLAEDVEVLISKKEIPLAIRQMLKEKEYQTENVGAAFLAFVGYNFAGFKLHNPMSVEKFEALITGEFSEEAFELFLFDNEDGFLEKTKHNNFGFKVFEIKEVSGNTTINATDLLACNAQASVRGSRMDRMDYIRQTAANHRIVKRHNARTLYHRSDDIAKRVAGLCIVMPQGFADEVAMIAENIGKLSKGNIGKIRDAIGAYLDGSIIANQAKAQVASIIAS